MGSDYPSVPRSTSSPGYQEVTDLVIRLRQEAGLSQRELAAKLGRELSYISRIKQGQRRLDLVEFAWHCKACGVDPEQVGVELLKKLSRHPIRTAAD